MLASQVFFLSKGWAKPKYIFYFFSLTTPTTRTQALAARSLMLLPTRPQLWGLACFTSWWLAISLCSLSCLQKCKFLSFFFFFYLLTRLSNGVLILSFYCGLLFRNQLLLVHLKYLVELNHLQSTFLNCFKWSLSFAPKKSKFEI